MFIILYSPKNEHLSSMQNIFIQNPTMKFHNIHGLQPLYLYRLKYLFGFLYVILQHNLIRYFCFALHHNILTLDQFFEQTARIFLGNNFQLADNWIFLWGCLWENILISSHYYSDFYFSWRFQKWPCTWQVGENFSLLKPDKDYIGHLRFSRANCVLWAYAIYTFTSFCYEKKKTFLCEKI